MEEIKNWLVQWFSNNSSKSTDEVLELISEDYFTSGLIDSFGFLSLLSDIEERFGTTFSNEDMLDRSFATISGLANIINIKSNS